VLNTAGVPALPCCLAATARKAGILCVSGHQRGHKQQRYLSTHGTALVTSINAHNTLSSTLHLQSQSVLLAMAISIPPADPRLQTPTSMASHASSARLVTMAQRPALPHPAWPAPLAAPTPTHGTALTMCSAPWQPAPWEPRTSTTGEAQCSVLSCAVLCLMLFRRREADMCVHSESRKSAAAVAIPVQQTLAVAVLAHTMSRYEPLL
jgi:hypothetical protein